MHGAVAPAADQWTTRGFCRDLASLRQMTSVAAERLAAASEGIDHPRIVEANRRMAVLGDWFVAAAEGATWWIDLAVVVAPTFAVSWLTAILAGGVFHLALGWLLAVLFATWLVVSYQLLRFRGPVYGWVKRRRIAVAYREPLAADPPVEPDTSTTEQIGAVVGLVHAIRRAVRVSAAGYLYHHRYAAAGRSDKGLWWLRERSSSVNALLGADAALCAVSDCLGVWLQYEG
jgi:hypothetical protein